MNISLEQPSNPNKQIALWFMSPTQNPDTDQKKMFIIDLKKTCPCSKVMVYVWHQNLKQITYRK